MVYTLKDIVKLCPEHFKAKPSQSIYSDLTIQQNEISSVYLFSLDRNSQGTNPKWSVWEFLLEGKIKGWGEFRGYNTLEEAIDAVENKMGTRGRTYHDGLPLFV